MRVDYVAYRTQLCPKVHLLFVFYSCVCGNAAIQDEGHATVAGQVGNGAGRARARQAGAAWASYIVVDRELITGQNPASAPGLAEAFLAKLK
jgi:putative intracellular protease/amidase